ncbi:exocyst complex component EXO70B1-like [Oryza brachyantha]|uniref:exocyst complex component EXO70B1-like n=1 Tax=Oryza brachyantha TaxID=4533 RepID=UPI001ADB6EED|nr:exocyst complex component EXO70B1-like [Oryza brachyantha]
MAAHARFEVAEVGDDGSSSGGSSPASVSGPSDSDGSSSTADEFPDARELRRRIAPPPSTSSTTGEQVSFHSTSPTSLCVLSDIDRHMRTMVVLLPAFACPAAAPRAEALARWLGGFDLGWVLEMGVDGSCRGLPRREVGRRVRVWTQAWSTMDRVFRLRHREVRNPINDAAAVQLAALGELASASAGAMLKLAAAVAALGSSPSTLLAALDVYVPVSEVYPGLARMFSWCAGAASHPVPAAANAALAALVDAARRCVRGLPASIRAHYPWRMPQGGEVHPCVGFWMGYFRCMLRNRVSLYLVLAGGRGDGDGDLAPWEGGLVVGELISCLEAVLEEKSGELAFPGLRQVFMLNNTHAIVRRAVRSDLAMFLPPGWARAREERMEGYVKSYLDASWAPVVSRLAVAVAAAAKPAAVSVLRRRRDPLAAFYAALENACSSQRCWKVPSPALRRVLRRTASEHVVPVYRRYLDEAEAPAAARAVEDVEQQLSELFEG